MSDSRLSIKMVLNGITVTFWRKGWKGINLSKSRMSMNFMGKRLSLEFGNIYDNLGHRYHIESCSIHIRMSLGMNLK